jgi:hypothetical protein
MLLSLHSRELVEKVAAKWISVSTNVPFTVSDKLRHEMQVTHLRERLSHIAEFPIRVYLFQVRLSQPLRICIIASLGSSNEFLLGLPDILRSHDRPTVIVLVELQSIPPCKSINVHVHVEDNIRMLASVKRSALGYATSAAYSPLKAALRIGHVAQKPKRIEKVRLSRRIGSNQERSATEWDLHTTKVAPILNREMNDSHGSGRVAWSQTEKAGAGRPLCRVWRDPTAFSRVSVFRLTAEAT